MAKNLPHVLDESDEDLDIGLESEDEVKHAAVPLVGKIAKNIPQSGKPANLEDDGLFSPLTLNRLRCGLR